MKTDLDYTLKMSDERLQVINKEVLKYDELYSDPHNLNLNSETCTDLERMANYLLMSDDIKHRSTKRSTKEILTISKSSLREDGEAQSTRDYSEVHSQTCPPKYHKKNFKKQIKQKIFAEDILNPILKPVSDYQQAILSLRVKVEKDEVGNSREKWKSRKMMTTMRDDQIWCKNNLLGTIYFKNTMRDTTVPNLQLFSFEDSKQIRALLKFIPSNNPDFTSDLDCLIYDLNILVRECEFDTNRLKIIQMIQDNYRVIDIARELKTSRQNVYQVYSNIIRQIILKYKSKKEDWLYLNYIKGVYKQCTECGETKLISNFNNSYYMCKQCKCIYDRVRRAK